jgi:hypothetical protein
MSGEIKGLENSIQVKMIDIETKAVTEFKSIAYAVRTTGINDYSLRQGLNPMNKKRFDVNGRKVCFRIKK